MYAGKQVKKALGLTKFPYVFVQKIINFPINVYIFTLDSRYPNVYMSVLAVKKSQSAIVKNAFRKGLSVDLKDYKLTPPLLLDHASLDIQSNSMIIRRDIAGDYFRNKRMFENKDILKGAKVIDYWTVI